MKIAVATLNDSRYAELAAITLPGKLAYCERHGYSPEFEVWDHVDGFGRYVLVERLLAKGYYAVAFLDCDTIVMNPVRTITEIISGANAGPGFIVNADGKGLNDGVFIAINGAMTREFLYHYNETAPMLFHDHPFSSQEALRHFASNPPYSHDPNFMLRWVEQRTMNSYINALYGRPDSFRGTYQKGDWIVHLPGLQYAKRLEVAAQLVAESA